MLNTGIKVIKGAKVKGNDMNITSAIAARHGADAGLAISIRQTSVKRLAAAIRFFLVVALGLAFASPASAVLKIDITLCRSRLSSSGARRKRKP